jgi:hypothetical protein
LAKALKEKIDAAEENAVGLASVGDSEVPAVKVTKSQAWRAAQSVHWLFEILQEIGIRRGHLEDGNKMLFM